jgi:Na+(H+)/acetate symporter ActP
MVVETALPIVGEVVLSTFTLGLLSVVGLSILLSTAEGFDVYFSRHS